MSTIDPEDTIYEETDLFSRYSTGIPFFLLNAVWNSNIPSDVVVKKIKENLTFFEKRQVPFVWLIGPSSSPKNMGESLIKNGLTFNKLPGMAHNLKTLGAEREILNKVEIIKVENAETLKIWNDVVLTGFEMPKELLSDFFYNWFSFMLLNDTPSASAFLAYYNGNPVASSVVCYEAGVAGIYNVTTLEEARGKGIGTAITLAPLKEAKKLGYETAILHSTDIGLNMYKQMGFKEYCTIEVFIWQPGSKE